MPSVAVLIPTYDHADMLRFSTASALGQTHRDLEVHILCDGATEQTLAVAREIAAADPRVRFHEHPKSARTGEPYRHELLQRIDATAIFYLSDDDLWFPEHVATLMPLLEQHDFVAGSSFRIDGDGNPTAFWHDLVAWPMRKRMLEGVNEVPLSAAAHRLDAYRRLPYGWRTTPTGRPTDLYMWHQWIHAKMRMVSAAAPTILNFPSKLRNGWTLDRRCDELRAFRDAVATVEGRAHLVFATFIAMRRQCINQHVSLLQWREAMVGAVSLLKQRPVKPGTAANTGA
jgi:glycosyltransferase involved in cell wall biosynthesis